MEAILTIAKVDAAVPSDAMFAFDGAFLDALSERAAASPRLRQHHNIHASYDDPCQRFLNAMEPGTYVRPNRHALVPRNKLLVALRGQFAVVLFNDGGVVTSVTELATPPRDGAAVAVEVVAGVWNTVLALTQGSVLLEVKAGPFDPVGSSEVAPWAPDTDAPRAREYLVRLKRIVSDWSASGTGSERT